MAKTKPEHQTKDKKARIFSTNAIFKKNNKGTSNIDSRKRLVGLRLCPTSIKGKTKHRARHQNPHSVAFDETIKESRHAIEERTLSRLENVHNGLVGQVHDIMEHTRQRMEDAESHVDQLRRSLDDDLLELTRKDGTITTVTLGERMKAYRRLLSREQNRLEGLFEQWKEVSKAINDIAIQVFGAQIGKDFTRDPDVENPLHEHVELRALEDKLKAESERAKSGALALGEKAVKVMKASEKDLDSRNKIRMLQICESMFADHDDGATA
ncbi:MAG: hypothetical protein Q9218_000203 [Villophora microphyllina]